MPASALSAETVRHDPTRQCNRRAGRVRAGPAGLVALAVGRPSRRLFDGPVGSLLCCSRLAAYHDPSPSHALATWARAELLDSHHGPHEGLLGAVPAPSAGPTRHDPPRQATAAPGGCVRAKPASSHPPPAVRPDAPLRGPRRVSTSLLPARRLPLVVSRPGHVGPGRAPRLASRSSGGVARGRACAVGRTSSP